MNPDMLKNCGSKIKTNQAYTNDISELSEELKIITENISALKISGGMEKINVTEINLNGNYNVGVYLTDEESQVIKDISIKALKRERLEKISELQNVLDSFTEKLTNEK